jgi:hypothetical protein
LAFEALHVDGLDFKSSVNENGQREIYVPSPESHKLVEKSWPAYQQLDFLSQKIKSEIDKSGSIIPWTSQNAKTFQDLISAVKELNKGILFEGVTSHTDMADGIKILTGDGDPKSKMERLVKMLNGTYGETIDNFLTNLRNKTKAQLSANNYQVGGERPQDLLGLTKAEWEKAHGDSGSGGGSGGRYLTEDGEEQLLKDVTGRDLKPRKPGGGSGDTPPKTPELSIDDAKRMLRERYDKATDPAIKQKFKERLAEYGIQVP